jgi:hypothetical protein
MAIVPDAPDDSLLFSALVEVLVNPRMLPAIEERKCGQAEGDGGGFRRPFLGERAISPKTTSVPARFGRSWIRGKSDRRILDHRRLDPFCVAIHAGLAEIEGLEANSLGGRAGLQVEVEMGRVDELRIGQDGCDLSCRYFSIPRLSPPWDVSKMVCLVGICCP